MGRVFFIYLYTRHLGGWTKIIIIESLRSSLSYIVRTCILKHCSISPLLKCPSCPLVISWCYVDISNKTHKSKDSKLIHKWETTGGSFLIMNTLWKIVFSLIHLSEKFIFNSLIIFHCVNVICVCVCVIYMSILTETRRQCCIPWNYSELPCDAKNSQAHLLRPYISHFLLFIHPLMDI